ncbi:fibronectin type III domain-containing protein-like isoform X2 [Rhopilema esculentum]|uniref:fibronectin type III domain-containing protein-like isoform X2 n=1 Tax=Rhopilema esculentum TaxID=499914 RepID=UPI0031DA53FF
MEENLPMMHWILLMALTLSVVVKGTPPQVDDFVIRKPIPRIESDLTPVVMYLDCSGSGDPPPTFSFQRNGVVITDAYPDKRVTFKDNTLTINNLNISDGGVYICSASNADGTVIRELDVKIRVLGQFVPESRAERDSRNHPVTLYYHTSMKCPKHSYTYPSIIEWGSVPGADNPRARIKRIPISNRVFYGNDGSLNFANVLQEDLELINDDYRGIQCLLSVGLGTRASNRFKMRKDRDFGSSYTKEPNFASHMVDNTVILKDQESIFTCGGFGTPTPTVEWYKDGVRIQNLDKTGRTNFIGYTLSHNDVELRIVRPRKEDEGVYRCWIRNSMGAKYVDSNLLVHFLPYWDKEIKDITLPVQSSTMFNCSATGKPVPTYEWYKNGTRLVESDHIKIDRSVLRIINARLIDKGMYICMARNKHGTITTQSFIDVQAVKPEFLKPLPDPMFIFRGRVGRIPCNPRGGPIPKKTWYKNNQIVNLNTGRISQDVNGTLVINNVEDSDKGRYKCVAQNIKGSAETSADVQVVVPTTIVVPPEAPNGGSTIKEGRDLVLVCNATYDQRLQLRIHWEKDGERIKAFDGRFMLEQRVSDAAPRLLIIKKLKFEDRGNYTCKAYTILSTTANVRSEDVATRYLSVSAAPDSPTSLTLPVSCANYRPTVEWRVGEANNDPMKFVKVEYSSDYPDDTNIWYEAGIVKGESANQFQFGSSLNPVVLPGNAAIKFRATAVNQVGASQPSKPSLSSLCVTASKQPSTNPENLTLVVKNRQDSDIVWSRMKIIFQEGKQFRYEVSYRIVGTAKWTSRNFTNSTHKWPIKPSEFTNYEICVLAYNERGPSTAPKKCITAYSYQQKLTIAPTGLRPTKIGYTDVDITWNQITAPSPGNIDGYRIYYWNITKPYRPEIKRGVDRRRKRRSVVFGQYPTEQKPYVVEYLVGSDTKLLRNVSELIPALRYRAYITAFNSGGEGPKSDAIVFETRATKSGIPDNIKMTIYGDVLHVQWEPPLEPNGVTTGYIMQLRPKRDFQKKKKLDHIVVDKIEREYYIRGMTPCVFYEVWIAAMNQAGEGQYFRRRMTVSIPDKPGRPSLPRVVPYDANAVNITYKLPGYGGLPTSFTVYYKHKDGSYYDADPYFNSLTVKGDNFRKRPWQTVKGLPELEYYFWTVGHNSMGDSINSDRAISQVMPYTRPGARTNEGPWYSSRWFVGALACTIFVLILLLVILLLVNKKGSKYSVSAREKDLAGWNGQASSEFHRIEKEPYHEPQATPMAMNDLEDAPLPPQYQSQGSIEKKPPSDEPDQDSFDEYGEDSRFQEDSSFIGQYGEEKRREAEEEESDEDPNMSMFV